MTNKLVSVAAVCCTGPRAVLRPEINPSKEEIVQEVNYVSVAPIETKNANGSYLSH